MSDRHREGRDGTESQDRARRAASRRSLPSRLGQRALTMVSLLGVVIVGLAVLSVVWPAYLDLHPSLTMEPAATSANLFETDFLLKNEGRLLLRDAKARCVLLVLDVPHVVATDMGLGTMMLRTPYEPIAHHGPGIYDMGDVPPLGHRSVRIPLPFHKADEVWRLAHVCIEVSYRAFPGWWEHTRRFGFLADRRAGRERWAAHPCQGPASWLRPVPTGEGRIYLSPMLEPRN